MCGLSVCVCMSEVQFCKDYFTRNTVAIKNFFLLLVVEQRTLVILVN